MAQMYGDVKALIEDKGQQVRFRYFNQTFNTGSYDDEVILAQSGADLWTSGFPQVIRSTRGSKDAVLMEQGLITTDDLKLYLEGSMQTDGIFKVQIGSPSGYEYSKIEQGTEAPMLNGSVIYRKLYLSKLTTGSLIGE